MFDHVTVRASDLRASEEALRVVLRVLGIERDHSDAFAEWQDFSLAEAEDDGRVTRRAHIAFVAPTREHADTFWRAGTEVGLRSDGEPGPRPEYGEDYYGAFLLDPDGNSIEATHHDTLRAGGIVDHVWIRVADVAAARDFYATIAPFAGLRLTHDSAERVRFSGASGSLSLVAGDAPTENLHLAFPAADDATVRDFHAAALAAGHRDNGAPGERPEYHPGYVAAFVLDPDGNNVELVNHHR